MTNAVHQAVTELFCISRPDRAFIGIIAYGARAALIPDKHGNPFLLSLRKIQAQLGKNLGQYLYDCVQNDIAGVNRYYSVLW